MIGRYASMIGANDAATSPSVRRPPMTDESPPKIAL